MTVVPREKIPQAFPLRFCILQAIKNWRCRRLGNEASVCGQDYRLMMPLYLHDLDLAVTLFQRYYWCIRVASNERVIQRGEELKPVRPQN